MKPGAMVEAIMAAVSQGPPAPSSGEAAEAVPVHVPALAPVQEAVV